MKKMYIYGLTDEFGQIRYVGQTVNPFARFKKHAIKQKEFVVTGFAPLDIAYDAEDANQLERKWIAFFGCDNLVNRTRGGSAWPFVTLDPNAYQEMCSKRKELWRNPIVRDRRIAGIRAAFSRSEVLERRSRASKAVLANPNNYARRLENLKVLRTSRKRIANARTATQTLAFRKLMSKTSRVAMANPETRLRLASTMKERWADPVFRNMMLTARTAESRLRQSKSLQLFYANPVNRQRQSEKITRYYSKTRGEQCAS